MRKLALIAAVLAAIPAVVHADPFDRSCVPADAKYVVHLDMDAARPTALWRMVDDRLTGNEQFGAKVGQFEQASGMRFPRDLHGVTIYGPKTGYEAVVVIRAKMNRQRMIAAVQTIPSYASEIFGKYDVASWDDDGRQMYAAFHADDVMVIGRSADDVKAALDTMDARVPAAAADSALAAGAKPAAGRPPTLLYLAAVDPSALGANANPMLKQIASGCLTVAEQPSSTTRPATDDPAAAADAVMRLTVRAKTPEAAQKLQQAAGGIRAMVGLSAMGQRADPNLKFAAAVLRTMTVTQTGNDVAADMHVGVDQLAKAVDRAADKRKHKADDAAADDAK